MSIWQKIGAKLKQWFGGGSTKKKTPPQPRAQYSNPNARNQTTSSRTASYGGGRKVLVDVDDKKERDRVRDAFRASAAKYGNIADATSTRTKDTAPISEAPKAKAIPPAAKKRSTALGTISEDEIRGREAKRAVDEIQRKEKERLAATLKPKIEEKYGRRTKESKLRVKMGDYMNDPDVAKYEVLTHPYALSAARGALSGTTFGLSELAARKLTKGQAREIENFYQANKSKGAEFIGEMGGALAGFGLTGNLSRSAVSSAAPNLTAKLGESATEFVAKRPTVINAARKEAIRKLGTTATEAEIAQFARERAARIIEAVGTDMAINMTTGAVSDISHALVDSDNPVEFAKNMGISAGMNLLLGGATSVAPELYRGSNLDDSIRAMGSDVADFGRDIAYNAGNKSGGIKLTPDEAKAVIDEAEVAGGKNAGKEATEAVNAEGGGNAVEKQSGKGGKKLTAKEKEEKEAAEKFSKEAEEYIAKLKASSQSKDGIIASGRNWEKGEDLAFWKEDGNLYVGNPKGEYKYFGKDLPENRIKAEDEFDFINNQRKQQFREAREDTKAKKKAKKGAKKAKTEEAPRPEGVRKFSDKQLLAMKEKGEVGSLTKEEYDYYIYQRAEDDPFLEKWDAAGTGGKASTKKSAKKEADSIEVAEKTIKPDAEAKSNLKSEITESESDTKILTKKKLEKRLARSEKRLKDIEDEIKKSSNAPQNQQDRLTAQYTKELEFKKNTEALIKEAEKSADGSIAVKKAKKKPPKKVVDDSDVTITKGKEELVDAPVEEKKKPTKKKGKKTAETQKAVETETKESAEASAEAEARKTAKAIKKLENKIKHSDDNIKRFDETLKEKRKSGASEKSIEYTQKQRAEEMKNRKDLKRELKKLQASADGEVKVAEAETKTEARVQTEAAKSKAKANKELSEIQAEKASNNEASGKKAPLAKKEAEASAAVKSEERQATNKTVEKLEKRIDYASKNIEKFERDIKAKQKEGASEKSINHLKEQRAKEMKRRRDLKKELKEARKKAEEKASIGESEKNIEDVLKEYREKSYKVAGKSDEELKKELADLSDDLREMADLIDSPNGIPDEKLKAYEYEFEKKQELWKTIDDELHSRAPKTAPAKDKALKKGGKAKPPEAKPMSKAAEARAKKEQAKERLDALLDKAEKHQKAYDGGDADALKELVATEREARQAFRDAGMSRADSYRESKKLFDEHEKALKKLEKQREKAKEKSLEYYKNEVAKSIDKAKAEEAATVNIGGKTYSAIGEAPFDEASTRTTRTKPKFTSNEKKAAKGKSAKAKGAKEAAKKLDKKANKFNRNPSPRGEGLHKNVYGKVKGEPLEEAITPPTFDDVIEAERTHLKGQLSNEKEVVSRAGTSLMNATTADAQRDFLREGWKSGDFNYVRIKNKEKYAEVMQRWVDEPKAVAREIIRYNNDISKLGADKVVDMHYQSHCVMKMLRKELDNPTLSNAERESVKDIYSAAAGLTQRLSSMSGQVNQFQGVMVGCSPVRRVGNALDNIVDMLDKAKGFRKNAKIEVDGKMVPLSENASERRNQIRSLLLDNEEIHKTLNKVYDATTEEEYGGAMEELMRKSYSLNSATGFDYLQQWRYLAMLGNPKTHLRNIVGNVTFGNIRRISNAIRSGLESGLDGWATKHGLEMEMHGGLSANAWKQAQSKKLVTDEAGKTAWESFEKHSKEILGDQKYNSPEMKGFLSELNSKALVAEDDFFRGRAYREQYIKGYKKYAKRGEITDAIKEKLHREALRESQITTFNEFNELAQLLAKSQSGLYDANASVGKKVASMASNALLPFTKVPSNILKQSVNYSPAGLAKGFAHIIDAAKKGDSEVLNKAIDELSSGLTGTAIAALGYVFGKNTDLFTTNAGSDDAAAKFKKQNGVQNYSVTFKASNGKEYSMTLDWLVPASSTFFMGVEIANQFKNGLGGADIGEAAGNLSQVTSRIIDPVLETSMLSGIYNIVEDSRKSASYDDQQSFANIVIRELVQSYLSSYVPTLSGQIARTAYGADKMVVGDGDAEYWVNSMKVKMGLANTDILGERLGDDVNAYGEVKNKKDGSAKSYAKSFVKNAILPANIQEVSLSELDKKKIKEYEDYVDGGGDPADKEYLFPKKSYRKNFTVGKEGAEPLNIELSNKQVSLYNQAKTTGGEEGMRTVLEGIMFNRYDKDSSGKRTILKNGYTKEQKEKLIKEFRNKSLREVEEWLYKQPQFRSATEEEKRRTLNALWSYSQQGKSQGAKRVGEQAVILDQGGDIGEYNFKNELSKSKQLSLLPAIQEGIVTYDEIVDFARNAGKTYYYESDEGGTANTYYNKKQMLEYLESKGYSSEKAEALFNAFKASNAKPYGGSSSGRRGYGRRGYRRYGRGGGGSSKAPAISQSNFKAGKETYKDIAASLKSTPKRSSSTASAVKVEPPKVKFKKYEV